MSEKLYEIYIDASIKQNKFGIGIYIPLLNKKISIVEENIVLNSHQAEERAYLEALAISKIYLPNKKCVFYGDNKSIAEKNNFNWIPRALNSEADSLASIIINAKEDKEIIIHDNIKDKQFIESSNLIKDPTKKLTIVKKVKKEEKLNITGNSIEEEIKTILKYFEKPEQKLNKLQKISLISLFKFTEKENKFLINVINEFDFEIDSQISNELKSFLFYVGNKNKKYFKNIKLNLSNISKNTDIIDYLKNIYLEI